MDADTTAHALGTPLNYVSGRPGDEILLAIRSHGGSGLLPRATGCICNFATDG